MVILMEKGDILEADIIFIWRAATTTISRVRLIKIGVIDLAVLSITKYRGSDQNAEDCDKDTKIYTRDILLSSMEEDHFF